MFDTSRFTPFYVIKMFLDILHYSNKNIIVPEVLLESGPTLEKVLRKDLEKINTIASSGDAQEIIKYVTTQTFSDTYNHDRYCDLTNALFRTGQHYVCFDLETFMKHIELPNIINQDVIKDYFPLRSYILCGNFSWTSVLNCVFRYILYMKTKHLALFEECNINFRPETSDVACDMKDDFIFNY